MAVSAITNTFTNGTNQDGPQVSANFTDVVGSLNAGFAQYRDLAQQTSLRTAIGVSTQFIAPQGVLATVIGTAASSTGIVYLDGLADYAVTGATVKFRLVSWSQTETAPTSSTLTTALYPISSTAAGVITLGTIVSGSSMVTGAITAANTRTLSTGTDFTAPAAGYYVVVFTHSANPAQTLTYGWRLQARVV